jgi:hypothetical protein
VREDKRNALCTERILKQSVNLRIGRHRPAGAAEVEVRVSGQSLIVRLAPSTDLEKPLEPAEDIVL